MATATEKAEVGAETARMEGRGPGGEADEAIKNVVTDRDGPGIGPAGLGNEVGPEGVVEDRGLMDHNRQNASANGGLMGRTEEELARLRVRTQITHEGEAYCPNPNLRDLPKEFETRVQIIQRYPEMRTVEKTDFVKEIFNEERIIMVPKTRVILEDVEHIDRVPVVRQVPKTRIEIVHRIVSEEREITEMVPIIEYVDVPRIEQVPRVITEDIEERITVPVVREVPVTRMVEIPTGNYCEAPAGEFINPGHYNLLGKHHRRRSTVLKNTKSPSSSSSSSIDETGLAPIQTDGPVAVQNPDGTISPAASKRKSLFRKIINH